MLTQEQQDLNNCVKIVCNILTSAKGRWCLQLCPSVRKGSLRQGNIFWSVCHSVHKEVCLQDSLHLGVLPTGEGGLSTGWSLHPGVYACRGGLLAEGFGRPPSWGIRKADDMPPTRMLSYSLSSWKGFIVLRCWYLPIIFDKIMPHF